MYSLFFVVRGPGVRGRRSSLPFFMSAKYHRVSLCGFLFLAGLLLTACSGLGFGGNSATTTPSASTTATLDKLNWCGKPLAIFRDEGALPAATATQAPAATATGTATALSTPSPTPTSTPRTITDWQEVRPQLGFTVYLPASLPAGTCLVSASGTVHDPILGSSFIIGYLLPDHSALSLSEAPLRSQNTAFQCSPASAISSSGANGNSAAKKGTPTATSGNAPVQICSGVRNTTNIVFSAQGTIRSLQQFFQALQPNVDWVPTS